MHTVLVVTKFKGKTLINNSVNIQLVSEGIPKRMRMPVFQYGYFNKLYAWAPQKLPECLQRTESANAVRPNNKLLIASTEIGFLITP